MMQYFSLRKIYVIPAPDFNTVSLVITSCGSSISQRGCQPVKERQRIIWPKFAENCMKMKKIGLKRRRPKFYYVDPALIMFSVFKYCCVTLMFYCCRISLKCLYYLVSIINWFHVKIIFPMLTRIINCWYSRLIGLAGENRPLLLV